MDLAPHQGHDIKGDMYEYLLSKLSQSGTNVSFGLRDISSTLSSRWLNQNLGYGCATLLAAPQAS